MGCDGVRWVGEHRCFGQACERWLGRLSSMAAQSAAPHTCLASIAQHAGKPLPTVALDSHPGCLQALGPEARASTKFFMAFNVPEVRCLFHLVTCSFASCGFIA